MMVLVLTIAGFRIYPRSLRWALSCAELAAKAGNRVTLKRVTV